MRAILVAVLSLLGVTFSTAGTTAHEVKFGALTIVHPWARATAGAAATSAVYLTIENDGAETDHLLGAATPAAAQARIHAVLVEDGVVKMRAVDAVELAPGVPAVLKPGGLHIMLTGLTKPLVEWDTFRLTLTFEKAGTTVVEVEVEAIGATDSGHPAMHPDGPAM